MTELEAKIKAVVEQIRPYLEADGGGLSYEGFENGVVRLLMRGPDSRCASLLVVQKLSIERRLLSEFTEVDRVDISAGLVPVEGMAAGESETQGSG